MSPAAELSVVVLSYRNEGSVLDALDSLLAQEERLELIVCHSGGGPTPRLIRRWHPGVRVLSTGGRWRPGEARNVGVTASSAPYVAFLAADCRAAPGWASGRLRRHRDGALAVASALLPRERAVASIASYLILGRRRMPHLDGRRTLRSGASYSREVLRRHGPFPETLVTGEDLVFNSRLREAGVEPEWAADVITEHAYPVRLRAMLSDQYRRGRMRGSLYRSRLWRGLAAAWGPVSPLVGLVRALRPSSPIRPRDALRSLPAALAGGLVSAVGAVKAGSAPPLGSAGTEVASLQRAWFGLGAEPHVRGIPRGSGHDGWHRRLSGDGQDLARQEG